MCPGLSICVHARLGSDSRQESWLFLPGTHQSYKIADILLSQDVLKAVHGCPRTTGRYEGRQLIVAVRLDEPVVAQAWRGTASAIRAVTRGAVGRKQLLSHFLGRKQRDQEGFGLKQAVVLDHVQSSLDVFYLRAAGLTQRATQT